MLIDSNKTLFAQPILVNPLRLPHPHEAMFIADEEHDSLVFKLEAWSQKDSSTLSFTSYSLSLEEGVSKVELAWERHDTLRSSSQFAAFGWRDTLVHMQSVILHGTDTVYNKTHQVKHDNEIVKIHLHANDSLRIWMARELELDSLDLVVYLNDSASSLTLHKEGYKNILCDSAQVLWQGKRVYSFVKPKRKLELPEINRPELPALPDVPLFDMKGLTISASGLFADTGIQTLPLGLPMYNASGNAKFSIGGIPIEANYFGYSSVSGRFEDLFVGRGSYFNVSYDKSSLEQVPNVAPDDPRLKAAIGETSQTLVSKQLDLSLKQNDILQKSLALDAPGVPDAALSDTINVSPTIDSSKLSGLDRWRLNRLSRKQAETERQQSELRDFYNGLDSLKKNGQRIDRDAIPTSMDGISADKVFNRAKLSKLEAFEVGNISPYRFGTTRYAFQELFGAATVVRPYKGIQVYGMLARNRVNSFLPQPALEVYEVGAASTETRLKVSLIASLERNLNHLQFGQNREVEAIDTLLVEDQTNAVLDVEYRILKSWSVGVSHVQPMRNLDAWEHQNQRTRLYTVIALKNTEFEFYGEQYPEEEYTYIDFSALHSCYKLGGRATSGFLKQQIRVTLGYEALMESGSDTGRSVAHAPLAQLDLMFKKLPTLSVSYMPFSNATTYFDPVLGRLISQRSQTEVITGVMSYQLPIDNLMWTAVATYNRVNNSLVYSIDKDQPAFIGRVESARIQLMAKGKRFYFSTATQYMKSGDEQLMEAITIKYALSRLVTVGTESSAGLVNRSYLGSAAGLVEIGFKGLSMGFTGGSYYGPMGYNPFARCSITQQLQFN